MEVIRALQPIEPYRPAGPIRVRVPTLLDELEAALGAIRGGTYTVLARGVLGQPPYNAVVRTTPGGDFLAVLDTPGTDHPDPEELLSLSRAAAVAGLGARTLQTAIRRGNLTATKLAPGAREWFISRGELHRYLMSRRRGSPAPLPAEYAAPRESR
ncbi:MAG TPA: hypothetical protein VNL71_01910 [Chloroflexota bacterium]|nr:hypothetical protein [Chloroflexota bacterium]